MKKFFKTTLAYALALIIAGLLLPIVGIGIVAGIAASSSESGDIEKNSVLFLDLNGVIEERAVENPLASIMDDEFKSYGLDEILAAIKEAKANENIKGIYLQAGAVEGASGASLEEIRGELASFKESGKFIVAYGDQYSQELYYLATVADKVILNPQGSIAWHGLASTPVFYKDLLEKIGVEMQVFKVGTYKSAVEPFIATEMSDANREQLTEMLDSTWDELLTAVSASRGVSKEMLNEYADKFMDFCPAEEYVECGMADTLLYKDGVLAYLKSLTGVDADDDLKLVTMDTMREKLKVAKKLEDATGKSKIAVYYAFGDIDGSTSSLEEGINSKKVIKELRELREDDDVKAVVLRVNSPGGSAYGSEQIWREVTLLKAAKPVVVSMGDYAASGGYYISCAADCIVASPITLTGSIGIFGVIPCAEKLLKDKLGLGFDVVKTNPMADFGVLSRTFTPQERVVLQNHINNGYALFLKRCADGRGVAVDDIAKIAEGRVWTGSKAKEIGLVDELGDLDKAVAIAAQKAGLADYSVKAYPAEKGILEKLMDTKKEDYMETMARETLGGYYNSIKFLRNIGNCDRIQARLPFELNIK
ncbi:MAG: signal peptide peptidase SppA [Bacteroidaceae bacterium]|nr:signal peptide peptidase SppA [Bacteroidaceae bacterium]